jgi:hypothetical protein
MLPAVLRIGANLGPLTNGSGILLFSSVIFKARSFCAYYFLKVHLHNFSKIKSHKEFTKSSKNHGFSYYFCVMIEGSGQKQASNVTY